MPENPRRALLFANNFDKSGISNYTVLTELIHAINIGVIS